MEGEVKKKEDNCVQADEEKMIYLLGDERLTCQRYDIFKRAVASNTEGRKRQCY